MAKISSCSSRFPSGKSVVLKPLGINVSPVFPQPASVKSSLIPADASSFTPTPPPPLFTLPGFRISPRPHHNPPPVPARSVPVDLTSPSHLDIAPQTASKLELNHGFSRHIRVPAPPGLWPGQHGPIGQPTPWQHRQETHRRAKADR